jgi:uncharacterized Zn-finger protein
MSYQNLKHTTILFVKTELDSLEIKSEEGDPKNETEDDREAVLDTVKTRSKADRRRDVNIEESEESEDTDNGDSSFQAPRKKAKSESGKFTFKCPETGCKRSFGSQPSLDAHLKIHGGATPGVCDICEKPLSSVKAMRKHRSTHLSISERSFSCDVCFKVYVR